MRQRGALLAPRLARRFSLDRMLRYLLAALSAGLLLRWLPVIAGLFVGTFLAGCAIAVGHVVIPP